MTRRRPARPGGCGCSSASSRRGRCCRSESPPARRSASTRASGSARATPRCGPIAACCPALGGPCAARLREPGAQRWIAAPTQGAGYSSKSNERGTVPGPSSTPATRENSAEAEQAAGSVTGAGMLDAVRGSSTTSSCRTSRRGTATTPARTRSCERWSTSASPARWCRASTAAPGLGVADLVAGVADAVAAAGSR